MAATLHRPLRLGDDGWSVEILDQTRLPHVEEWRRLTTADQVVEAISSMRVRGAPLIGLTAAYGIALALRAEDSEPALELASEALRTARPTAVNLARGVELARTAVDAARAGERVAAAYAAAAALAEEELAASRAIGEHGLVLIRDAWAGGDRRRPVQVLTHCNAGWLATVGYGTALAPVYRALEERIPVHVWVDETRPRNQGWLTAWELARSGVAHTVVVDNASGLLLQRGEVDLVLVGSDRTTRTGDVCNKIGTYLKALAAHDAHVPFYAALPSSTVDWALDDGSAIRIEERAADEVTEICGLGNDGRAATIRLAGPGTAVRNPAFDVTPARLVTGLLTERGLCPASEAGLLDLFPEHRA